LKITTIGFGTGVVLGIKSRVTEILARGFQSFLFLALANLAVMGVVTDRWQSNNKSSD